ncbi:MSCRAMM family protein [Terracidiphilus gabretensis]|jgi:hypothetical protein|uniref:MSCRAMM family protein n=1 Tax=Terracidiphilus gabretensis TaxID=1577687 RepID=UPI00071B42C3|nr:carboxypeptidase-like regulatory domain-containing protein [Terracidiphilus gabretensis]
MRLIPGIVLFAIACTASSSSQEQRAAKSRPPRGVITGTIYCADTNTPARLAHVTLLPATNQSGQTFMAQSDLEGRFAIGRVPEGTYYVSAKLDGYLDPFPRPGARGLNGMSSDEKKQLDAQAIRVSVAADQTASIAVRLERAAVMEGTVLYDDGSPAIGLQITIHPKQDQVEKKVPEEGVAILMAMTEAFQRVTDDHGHFRALGLAPGEYLVSTMVSTASGAAPPANPIADAVKFSQSGGLTIYYGDTPRKSNAKPVKIEGGESVPGIDITIPLSKLHSIQGQVLLKRTGQPPAMASLQLLYADSHEFARTAVAVNGEFALDYVPEGSYILQASASTDPVPAMDQDTGDLVVSGSLGFFVATGDFDIPSNFKQDSSAETPLDVHGEVAAVTIYVPDPAAKKPATASMPYPTVSVQPPQQ